MGRADADAAPLLRSGCMSDDKGKSVKETIADEAKGLGIEVYRDAAKPAVSQVGQLVGSVTKLVFWPIKLAFDTANEALGRLSERVERKAARIPADRLLPPPAMIAAPAALSYALLGDGPEVAELREMFENLLVTSMDREMVSNVHPAFVQMIAQLTPDEAWIIKSITKSEYAATHVQDFSEGGGNGVPRGLRTLLGRDIGIDESRLPQYISNLDRLGIMRIDSGQSTTADYFSYEKIEALVNAEFPSPDPNRNLSLSAGVIFVTALGAQFLATCANVHIPAARYG